MAVLEDDFVVLEHHDRHRVGGPVRLFQLDGADWPPPETIWAYVDEDMGMVMAVLLVPIGQLNDEAQETVRKSMTEWERESYSQLTDEQSAASPNVARGALYRPKGQTDG
jgi:hypothetical protein